MMDNFTYTDKLYHHGIKGQKWGIRNGPPYPIEDKTLHKGTRLNSVSYIPDPDIYKLTANYRAMYTYNPNDKWDSKVYKGPFSMFKMRDFQRQVFEHQYKVVKDLTMPTKKERVDEFINLYTNNKRLVVKDLKEVQSIYKRHKLDEEQTKAANLNVKKLKTKEDYDYAYQLFNHAMENVGRFKSAKMYSDIMAGKYDAMVDDNNQGIYNMAHDPIIIFRANTVLETCGKTRMVTAREIIANTEAVRAELDKYGISVKL